MNQAIINIIKQSIEKPAFLVDSEFNMIECNEAGNLLISKFDLKELDGKKIFEDSRHLRDKVKKIKDDQSQEINVELKSDENKYKYTFTAQLVSEAPDHLFLLVAFEDDTDAKSKYKFNAVTDEVEKYLQTEEIKKIIAKVKSAYPFTFIGKQKFQHDIDKLEHDFFIRESDGKFVISNKAFAEKHNEKVNVVSGKKINDFVSGTEAEVVKSADNFVFATKKPILYMLQSRGKKTDYLSIPLIDMDHQIIAIITISIISDHESAAKSNYEDYINELNEPVIIMNDQKEILLANKKYKSLFTTFSKDKESVEVPDSLKGSLNSFIEDKEMMNLLHESKIKSDDGNEYRFYLRKINFRDDQKVIIIEPLLNDLFNQQNELKVKMYDIIMHTSPEAMFIYDIENLKFLEVNNAALKLYGYTRDDFLEMDLTDLYAPEDIQTLIESSPNKTITSDFTGPWRHKHKNGSTILVELSKSTLEFDGKRAHFNIVRDVTQYLEDQTKLQKYKAAFENSSDLMVSTDEDGFITSSNNNFLMELGYSKEEIDQKPMLSLVNDIDRSRLNAEIFHSGIKTKISFNTKLKTADKKEIPVKLIADPILNYDDEIKGYNLTCLLQLKNDASVSAVKETQDSNHLDQSFLSNLFHDILTPINVITGFVQELSESIETPSEDQAESIKYIKDNQQMLLQIMDNAAEYSNLVQDEVELTIEPIVFVDQLEELEQGVAKTAESKNISLTYGKISSSLKYNSDKQKFNTFISLFARFAIASTNQSKIYLSAYQKTTDKFIVCLRDERSSVTNEFLKNMEDILTVDESIVKQKFGISRFAIRLFKKLILLLGAEKIILKQDELNTEFAFEFPMTLDKNYTHGKVKTKKESKEPEVIIEGVQKTDDSVRELETIKAEVEEVKNTETLSQTPSLTDSQTQSINVNVNLQPQPQDQTKTAKIDATSGKVEKESMVETPQQETAKPAEALPSKRMDELSCLYVEDQVDSQILFKVQMKDLKSIEFATSFEKALPMMQLKEFDFMVMDINLQGEYNGLDALRAIQKMPGLSDIPIIAVTAYVLPGDREKFIAAGFTDFITKPILRDKLENVLKKIFPVTP